jgi:type IV pilus assembly protein PilE
MQTNGSAGPTSGAAARTASLVGRQNRAMQRTGTAPLRLDRGFTLIELMIAVVIVVVLAAVALPSFFDSLYKSRRTDAFTAIAAVQQAQERHRSNNASYSSDLTAATSADPPGLGLSSTTSSGYYSIALSSVSPTGYTVSAVAVDGKSQVKDGNCARLAARMTGARIEYGSCATCSTFTFAESDACWAR